jgi:hypothetical protein
MSLLGPQVDIALGPRVMPALPPRADIGERDGVHCSGGGI